MNAAFTIVAKNYLAFALTLADSLEKVSPGLKLFIYVVDDLTGVDEKLIKGKNVEHIDETIVPLWRSMAFKYSVTEYSTSVKPFIFNHLLAIYEKVMYVDPDIYFYSSASVIFDMLQEKSIVLTPHILEAQKNYEGNAAETEFLFAGIFNLGFIALKRSPVSQKLINWWMNRLETLCYADRMQSLHVDQKWMDFVPAIFSNDLLVCRHPGMNIAYWNIHERIFSAHNNETFIASSSDSVSMSLVFLHFSGVNPLNIYHNKQCKDLDISRYPLWETHIKQYAEAVLSKGHQTLIQLKYSFNSFSNGDSISHLHRRLYRRLLELKKADESADPFATGTHTYHAKLKDYSLLTGKEKGSIDASELKAGKSLRLFNMVLFLLKSAKTVLGVKRYYTLIRLLQKLFASENQVFLMKEYKQDFIDYYAARYF